MRSTSLLLVIVLVAGVAPALSRDAAQPRAAAFEAWLETMNKRADAGDAEGLARGMAELRLTSFDEVEKAGFRAAGLFADTVRSTKGDREAIAFLDRLERKLPPPRTDAERELAAELLVTIGRQRADALVGLGEMRGVEHSLSELARKLDPHTADATSLLDALRRQYSLVGHTAPELTTDGQRQGGELLRLRGRVVVIDFFAHFCAPCITALPHLENLHRDARSRGFEIVTVNRPWGYFRDRRAVDEAEERSLAQALFAEHRPSWRVVFGPKENFDAYSVRSLPVAFVLDRAGRVRFVHHGYSKPGIAILRRDVETLLADPAPRASRRSG